MKINLRDTGTEIGLACSRVLALSSCTLIGSLIVSGAVVVAGEFPAFKAPHRVAKMSAFLMGASAAGCILGAWMTGAIGKDEREELKQEWQQREQTTITKEFILAEKQKWAPVEARDREIFRRGQKIRELHQQLEVAQGKITDWEDWWETAQSLDTKYEVWGCKGCKNFHGSDNGGNFFVCAIHPYGQRNCEDREQ